jgi:hypothetical protein
MLTAEMTNAQKVVEFLRMHKGWWYCDACISESTGVEPSNQVNQIARPLGETTDFDRAKHQCKRCGSDRTCTRLILD